MASSSILNFTGTLIRNLFSEPVTKNYPEEPAVYPERTRGHIEIDIDQCISCGLCVRSCPPRCIIVDKADFEAVSTVEIDFSVILPSDTAYAETCAAIGLCFFARRGCRREALRAWRGGCPGRPGRRMT